MRRLALVLLLPLAGCGAAAGPAATPHAAASCADAVRWHGTLYVAARADGRPPRRGGRLGRGAVPGCADTVVDGRPGNPGPHRSRILWRIRGVSPRRAVMTAGRPRTLYLSHGCVDVCRRFSASGSRP